MVTDATFVRIEATGEASRSSVVELPVSIPATGGLLVRVAELDARATWIGEDVAALHDDVIGTELERRARQHEKRSVQSMLIDLGEDGFSWRDIARLAGVTVPAVRKWRRGDRAAPERIKQLARVCAAIDMLRDAGVNDVASWFELPLKVGVSVSCLDLATAGRFDLVLRWGTSQHSVPAESVLGDFDPDWRSMYVDDQFEVYLADDGVMSIRPRSEP